MRAPEESSAILIRPAKVRYIKLGAGGCWEEECLKAGAIRVGFGTESSARLMLCRSRDWEGVAATFRAEGKTPGTATRFSKELRLFFDDAGETLWITFMNERLQWGFLDESPAEAHRDGEGVWRRLREGWRSTDLSGTPLSKHRLSGALTKMAAYRGTSCEVEAADYVVRRINCEKLPVVQRAIAASQEMSASLPALIQMLTPQDFEILVDLVFTSSGWRREGAVGKAQDTLDFVLFLPSTEQRAFVQVKSNTTRAELEDYIAKLDDRGGDFSRMFYVYHSGELVAPTDSRITLIGPERLATMTVAAGLAGWLIEKVS